MKNVKFEEFGKATDGNLYDADYGWLSAATETHDTLAGFVEASNSYKESTREVFGEVGGLKYVAFEKVQVRAGDQRRPLSVIDFGDYRIALDAFIPHEV